MTLVKICGIRTVEEGRVALHAGADWLGFVFHPPSPRHLTVEQAATVVRALRQEVAGWSAVAVMVNPTAEEARHTIEMGGFDLVQLCGDEDPGLIAALPVPAIKVLRVEPGRELEVARSVREDRFGAARYLLDTHREGLYGGTGRTFDWASLQDVSGTCIVAGGLRPDNVGQALAVLAPFGVDVSGGVEFPGGGKDPGRVKQLIETVRAHDADPTGSPALVPQFQPASS